MEWLPDLEVMTCGVAKLQNQDKDEIILSAEKFHESFRQFDNSHQHYRQMAMDLPYTPLTINWALLNAIHSQVYLTCYVIVYKTMIFFTTISLFW